MFKIKYFVSYNKNKYVIKCMLMIELMNLLQSNYEINLILYEYMMLRYLILKNKIQIDFKIQALFCNLVSEIIYMKYTETTFIQFYIVSMRILTLLGIAASSICKKLIHF